MAKKGSGGDGFAIIFFLVVSAVTAAFKWAKENTHIIAAVGAIFIFSCGIKIYIKRRKQAAWVAYLKDKYKKDEIVERILNSEYWTGQTSEQLVDSLGSPHAKDRQVLKTKTKETWKYHEQRKGQFALRILVENGKVIGWDAKN